MNAASPWDVLMHRIPAVKAVAFTSLEHGRSKTDQLLQIIDQLGYATTMRLCLETDLDSRQVWGLLKQHRKSGRVEFVYGEWRAGKSAMSIKVLQAVELLRAQGWMVVEPGGTGA